MRWWTLVPLALAVVLAIAFAGWTLTREPRPPADLIGKPVPETVLPMLSGATVGPGILDLKTAGVGRPMLVNVFASWCAPCRAEHASLMALKARGVAVVGIALRDRPGDTRAFLDELGDPYAMVLVDTDGVATRDLGVEGPPHTFAVDAMGKVVGQHPGPLIDPAEIEILVASMQAPYRPLPAARAR